MFLQGTGSALAIPFLQSLLPREAWAQTVTPAKRFVGVMTSFDIGHISHFVPSLDKPAQQLSPAIPFHQPVHYTNLSSYLGSKSQISRMIGPEFNPYLRNMNIFRGLDLGMASHRATIGHNMSTHLGVLNGPANEAALYSDLPKILSMDQVLNNSPKFNPLKRPSYFWYFGSGGGALSYQRDSSGQIVATGPTTKSVLTAYNSVFNSGAYPESGETVPPHPRRDILTRIMDDYKRVKNGRQISSLDKIVLDNALDKISDLQRSLDASIVRAGCFHKHIDKTTINTSHYTDGRQTLKNFADLITATLMCDLSRTMLFSTATGASSKYDLTTDGSGFHQGHSHGAYNVVNGKVNHEHMADTHAEFIRYFIAPLVQNLSAATDPTTGKSLLETMVVHYSTEHSMTHRFDSRPTMMFGNAGGAIKTGYYMDYVNYNGISPADLKPTNDITASHLYTGTFYNRLLLNYLQGLGLSPSDYENPTFNTPLSNLTNPVYGAHNLNLGTIGGFGHTSKSSFGANDYKTFAKRFYGHYKHPLTLPAVNGT
jgi:hypothetical protein